MGMINNKLITHPASVIAKISFITFREKGKGLDENHYNIRDLEFQVI